MYGAALLQGPQHTQWSRHTAFILHYSITLSAPNNSSIWTVNIQEISLSYLKNKYNSNWTPLRFNGSHMSNMDQWRIRMSESHKNWMQTTCTLFLEVFSLDSCWFHTLRNKYYFLWRIQFYDSKIVMWYNHQVRTSQILFYIIIIFTDAF